MSTSVIVQQEERAELEAVLSSGIFSRAPHQARLLAYVCEEYFAGRADQVKEYNLAMEVLGKPADFDQSRDAIVRVEFHRLRRRLKEFYDIEGAGHPVRILIQPGQYVPQFVRFQPASPANDSAASGEKATANPEPAASHGQPLISIPSAEVPPFLRSAKGGIVLAAIIVLAVVSLLFFRKPRTAGNEGPGSSAAARNAPTSSSAVASDDIRILAGYLKDSYIDRAGSVWQGDRYFTGGTALAQPRRFIARTSDPTMYQTLRSGEFSYDIPLKPGTYELRLYFVETHYGPDTLSGGGETSRLFDIFMNGRPLLHLFDIIKDAGGNDVADVRVFKDVEPAADGKLHLRFAPLIDAPVLNALEVLPAPRDEISPIRIAAQENSYADHAGHLWSPDQYARGGQFATHIHRTAVTGTPDPDLYVGERFGNFDYAIPVAPGKYTVTLHFAETYWGLENQRPGAALPDYSGSPEGGVGSRIFNVYFGGRTLLKNFDIVKDVGGPGRALDKTFTGLEPDAQGKLVLSFVPVTDYACVNAIEVLPEPE
jgi:hypothetical protein